MSLGAHQELARTVQRLVEVCGRLGDKQSLLALDTQCYDAFGSLTT
jgi:hypothetical protein